MRILGVNNWTCKVKATVSRAHESQDDFHYTPAVSTHDRLQALDLTKILDGATLGTSICDVAALASVTIDSINMGGKHNHATLTKIFRINENLTTWNEHLEQKLCKMQEEPTGRLMAVHAAQLHYHYAVVLVHRHLSETVPPDRKDATCRP